MKRRTFAAAVPLILASRLLRGQAPSRVYRIGFLVPRQRSTALAPILKRLAELGFEEGRNLILEYKSSDGVVERFPALARELLEAKCDLILAVGTEHPARALIDIKATVPIVLVAFTYDPVRLGFVSSLRRPGGNITGVMLSGTELTVKRLEILVEFAPKAKRFLVLTDRHTDEQLAAIRETSDRLHVTLHEATFGKPPYAFESAFEQARKAKFEAALLLDSPVFFDQRLAIGELALKHRLPMSVSAQYADVTGFLFGYGADQSKSFARAGDITANILKGGAPAEIPVEQPTAFQFFINRKTAKALGISIPQAIAARANRIID